jgi:hypothetical protein
LVCLAEPCRANVLIFLDGTVEHYLCIFQSDELIAISIGSSDRGWDDMTLFNAVFVRKPQTSLFQVFKCAV